MLDMGEIFNSVVASVIIGALSIIFGVPQYLLKKVRAVITRGRIKKLMAAGLYDDVTLNSALRYYVRPKYASVDPAEYQEPSESLLDARADLFKAMDTFLSRRTVDSKYMFVLGDSGMGKTSFILNYFSYNYRLTNFKKKKLQLVSLSQSHPERLIESISISDRKDTNLLLDAFDEDPMAIGRIESRLAELLSKSEGYRTITISCRTQFFLSEKLIPVDTKIAKPGVVSLSTTKHYKFTKIYIAPFDEDQVTRYLRHRYPGLWRTNERRRAKEIVEKVPSLSVRPMLLAHMPEILASRTSIGSAIEVYDEMIRAWSERESRWIKPVELLQLSEYLAIDFYRNREERGGEFADPAYIVRVARAIGVEAIEDHITSRSLLNRTTSGQYKFSHRSILEYFLARAVFNGGAGLGLPLTDQTAKFIAQRIRCMSDPVETFLTSCSIGVEVLEPALRLGHPTNFGLMKAVPCDLDTDCLLNAIGTINLSGISGSMEHLVAFFASAYSVVSPKAVSHIRIAFERSRGKSQRPSCMAVWFGAIVILAKVTFSSSDIYRIVSEYDVSESEFTLVGSILNSDRNVRNFKWVVEQRNAIVESQRDRAGDLSAIDNSYAIAFEYNPEINHLIINMIEGYVDNINPFGKFGILGIPETMKSMNASFTVLGPVRIKPPKAY